MRATSSTGWHAWNSSAVSNSFAWTRSADEQGVDEALVLLARPSGVEVVGAAALAVAGGGEHDAAVERRRVDDRRGRVEEGEALRAHERAEGAARTRRR